MAYGPQQRGLRGRRLQLRLPGRGLPRETPRHDQPDALTSSGNTLGNVSFVSTKGIRDVWSIYWEVRLPVTSPAWNLPGFYSLELDYQERFENFSDFGGTERPKFSVRW